jgi:hypothetical protein
MKYRHFRNVVALVVFGALGGTCYGCFACWNHEIAAQEAREREERRLRDEAAARAAAAAEKQRLLDEQQQANRAAALAADAAVRAKDPGAFWLRAADLRPVDKDALALLGRPVVDKIKDGARGKPYKVNVYSDDGRRFTRLKIDLDRDEKDDESWTVHEDGRIDRKVSTADDGNFNRHDELTLQGWRPDAPPAPTTTTTPTTPTTTKMTAAAGPGGLRPVDEELLRLARTLPVTDKVKDATKGRPYKVNLYSDDGARFGRAKIDLDRDDKWDESWTLGADGSVERKVAPNDDENYSETWALAGQAWQRK